MKTEVYVLSVNAHRVDGLPDHYLREKEAVITSFDVDNFITKASQGHLITARDFANIYTPGKLASANKLTLTDSWNSTRYYISLIVRIIECREEIGEDGVTQSYMLSDTTRTIMGWTSYIPTPSGYLPDEAVIHINNVIVRKSSDVGMGGMVLSSSALTGLSEDEVNTVNRKIIMPSNVTDQLRFKNSFDSSKRQINVDNLDDDYSYDAKATKESSMQENLADVMNGYLYDNNDDGFKQNNSEELDDFIVSINMLSDTVTSGMVKSFTWKVFKLATDWSDRVNRIEVDDLASAPSYNPEQNGLHGTMESDTHDTSELAINDVGYPLLVAILPYISRYGLALLNVRSVYMHGTDAVTVVNMARPLDGSILPEQVILNLERRFQEIINRYIALPHINAIDLVIDGGFAKPTGILISVNHGVQVPFVVSSAMSSIFSENVTTLEKSVLDRLGDAIEGSDLKHIYDVGEFAPGRRTAEKQVTVISEDEITRMEHAGEFGVMSEDDMIYQPQNSIFN